MLYVNNNQFGYAAITDKMNYNFTSSVIEVEIICYAR